MTASIIRDLVAPTIWRSLWDRLGEVEEALSLKDGDVHNRRASRLEDEIAELRSNAGLRPRTDTRLPSVPN